MQHRLRRPVLRIVVFVVALVVGGAIDTVACAQDVSVTGGAVQSNNAPASYNTLTVSGTSAGGAPSTYTANASLFTSYGLSVSNNAVFNMNADVTNSTWPFTAGRAYFYSGAVLNLNSGQLNFGYLIDFNNATMNRAGGTYSTSNLGVNSCSVTYAPGDFADSINLDNNARLTLLQNLSIYELRLANGASVVRTNQTLAPRIYRVDNATIDLRAGDSAHRDENSFVRNGGVMNVAAGVYLGGQIYVGGGSSPSRLNVSGNTSARVAVNADSSGIINLLSGTLSTDFNGRILLSGSGALAQNGGHYSTGWVRLSDGASITYGPGDSILSELSIDGAGSLLEELSPLSLDFLTVGNGGVLRLSSFTGSGAVANWGLRLGGNKKSDLESLIAGNSLTGGPATLAVVYDPGSNATYVTGSFTAVPEIDPAGFASVLALVTGALGLVERRRQRQRQI
ncbi:MAG: hypothetical protein KGQ61_09785 [Planctomycetes bacterium]|nr:hypothetical protein [Planctomycetota bacterium]